LNLGLEYGFLSSDVDTVMTSQQ